MKKLKQRIMQLKFIASMFKMAMEEFNLVMGPETIQTIFRLIGEREGEAIEKKMRAKFKIESWTPECFAEKLTEIVLKPTLGEGQSEIKIEDDSLTVKIFVCPFQKAGINIKDKFYCTYTEGLIETAAKNALDDINFKSEHLKATGADACIFKIKTNK